GPRVGSTLKLLNIRVDANLLKERIDYAACTDIPGAPGVRPCMPTATVSLTATMTAPFLPFALPDIGQAEIDAVVQTLQSGWLTTGPSARLFEQEFAEYLGADLQAVGVNSATAGLHLALEA